MTPQEQAQKYAVDNFNNPMHQLVAADSFLAGHAAANEWVSVTDRLPDNYTRVLCYEDYKCRPNYYLCSQYNGSWFDENSNPIFPTHWLPLPAPPTI